jgi:hypothetical protein
MFQYLLGLEDIKGYEGLYKINRMGQVWTCFYNRFLKPILSPHYYTFTLSISGVHYKEGIHRLLGLQYIKNPNNLPYIDHIDMNKTNNNLENLRWITRGGNQKNQTKQKDNTSGYKNITNVSPTIIKGVVYEYWRIQIEDNNVIIYYKNFNKKNYTLDQVYTFRNNVYKELGLKQYD